MIYEINTCGKQTPYIVYGIDKTTNIVFAISIKKQQYDCDDRIYIDEDKIINFCFTREKAETNDDGEDEIVLRDALNKNEKHIKKYFKKNGFIWLLRYYMILSEY